MSMSNLTEEQTLAATLKGTDLPFRAGANVYLALFTADPTEAGVFTNEATYTGYARVAVPKSTGWSGTNPLSNSALIQFPKCTGGSNVVTHFAICTEATSGQVLYSAPLNRSRTVDEGIQVQFDIGGITVSMN